MVVVFFLSIRNILISFPCPFCFVRTSLHALIISCLHSSTLPPAAPALRLCSRVAKPQHHTATPEHNYLQTLFSVPFLAPSSFTDHFCLFLQGRGNSFYWLSCHALKTLRQGLYAWKFTWFCAPGTLTAAEIVPNLSAEESEASSVLYTSIKPHGKISVRKTQTLSLMCVYEITRCICYVCRSKTIFNFRNPSQLGNVRNTTLGGENSRSFR